MQFITADTAVQAAFAGIDDLTEVRDPSGALLGYMAPAGKEESLLYARAIKLFDSAELDRRSSSGSRGYTIQEVQQHLRSLEAT